MNNDKVNELLDSAKKDILKTDVENLKIVLESAEEDKYEKVSAVKLKKVSLTAILSSVLGLFGAGDFYLGNFKRGIVKLVCSTVLPLILIFTYCFLAAPDFDLYKRTNVPYFAINYNRVVESETLLGSDMRSVTIAEVLGEDAKDGDNEYVYSFAEFDSAYKDPATKRNSFNTSVTALDKAKPNVINAKTAIEKEKEKLSEAKQELTGEEIPEVITNYENALTSYQQHYADYEEKVAVYEAKLEVYTDYKGEIEPLKEAIKEKLDKDIKEFNENFDKIKKQLNDTQVDEKFNDLVSVLKSLETKINGLVTALTAYAAATETYDSSILAVQSSLNKFIGYKNYYGYIINNINIDKAVDETYGIKKELSEFIKTVEKLANKMSLFNGEGIKDDKIWDDTYVILDEAYGHIEPVRKQLLEYRDEHCLKTPILNLLLIVAMMIYLTIVAVYWVFEVFRNRDKCKKLNYDNLTKSLA